jgi:hypothetical protein
VTYGKISSKSFSMKLSELESIARDLRAQLVAVGRRVDDLNAQVDAARREPDGFASFLYSARKAYSHAIATDGKGGKKMERASRMSYLEAQKYGFKGTIQDWEGLLRLRTQPEQSRHPFG